MVKDKNMAENRCDTARNAVNERETGIKLLSFIL